MTVLQSPGRGAGERDPMSRRPHADRRGQAVLGVGIVVAAAYLATVTWAMNRWRYTTWVVLLLLPLFLFAGLMTLRWATRRDAEPMVGLLVVALVVKLLASFARFFVSFELYGSGDSMRYHVEAVAKATEFLNHQIPWTRMVVPRVGTESITDLTAVIYTLIGPSRIGAFVVFSFLGYWGLFFFYRAFITGLPEGDTVGYARLVFFLPSLVYWPSSIGKEAVMTFAIGLAALGAARISRRVPGGWLRLTLGLVVGGIVRPHVSAVILVAVIVMVMFRRPIDERQGFGVVGRFGGIVLLMLALAFAFGQTAKYLVPASSANQDQSSAEVIGSVFDRATSGTSGGGSEIDRPLPNNPFEYPYAAFTVLFRPGLWEARDPQNLLAAAETTVLLGVIVARRRRFRELPRTMFRRPYVLFAIVYTGVFCFAWSAFANLGALARQRVQAWPIMLVVLCLPTDPIAVTYRKRQGGLRHRTVATPRPSSPPTAERPGSAGRPGGPTTLVAPIRRRSSPR